MMFECIDKIYPSVSIDTVTGSIVSFTDEYGGLPLKSCVVEIPVTQEGSGTPSPDNVRTINGYSNINIMATGKNFAPINARTETASGITITVDNDGIASVSGTGTGSHFFEYYRGNFNFPKGTYRFTVWVNGEEYTQSSISNSPYRFYFFMTNGGQINAGNSFTITQDTGLWIIYIQTRNGFTFDNDEVKIQIELGTVATEWQKFGKLVAIPFGQTVYSGSLDVLTGVLTIDTGKVVATNDGNWRFDIAGGLYNYVYYRSIIISSDFTKLLSNIAPTVSQSADLGITRANLGFIQMYVNELGITSLAEWNTYITNNTVEIVYPLDTPIVIPLGGINLLTQEGVNNIFCDTGNTTVEYIKIV